MYAIRSYYAGTIIAFRPDGESDIDAAIENALNDEAEQTLVLEDEQNMASVITSYSIHYTKLYDISPQTPVA